MSKQYKYDVRIKWGEIGTWILAILISGFIAWMVLYAIGVQ